MANYILTLKGPEDSITLTCDPMTSSLTDEWGAPMTHPMFEPDQKSRFYKAPAVSDVNPGKKEGIKTLKIQMGFSCNYACSYCNQSKHNHFVGGMTEDAKMFLDKIPEDWKLERIEFWGGEPFVYWAKMKVLIPAFRKRYPDAHFNVITNGSLLDDEKADFLIEHKIGVNISHDGPAHWQRHPTDILDDPEICRVIRRLIRHGMCGWGTVLTRFNYSLAVCRTYIEEKLELPPGSIFHNTEEILLPYDDDAMETIPQDAKEHDEALHTLFWEAVTMGTAQGCNSVRTKIEDWFWSLGQERPLSSLGQKCGMDRADSIAVNLMGDVTTCHNTAPDMTSHNGNGHKIGTLDKLDEVKLDTAYHHSTRKECMSCPLVQLCKGSCMFLTGEHWEGACDVSFTYNLALFAAALYFLTGRVLVKIESDEPVRAGRSPKSIDVIREETIPA